MIGFPSRENAGGAARWSRRREAPVFGQRGMVASQHPLATAAGLQALANGGNAVDAAVCAAITAAVVMPAMCGLGGDLFAIVHAPGKETVALQGSGIAPRGATIEQMREAGPDGKMPQQGPLSVAVPGMVDGYFTLLERFGTRSFGQLAEPAIGHAEGHPLTPVNSAHIEKSQELLGRFPASAAVFLPGGKVPAVGSIWRQTDLVRTLRQIAEGGRDVFYRGDIAKRIGAYMESIGGALRAEDFADHATDVTPPISTTYRGYTVYETTLPTQGMILLESLNIAEQANLSELGVDTADGVHLLAEAKKLAFADRLRYAGDPKFVDTPLSTLISKDWAAHRYGNIDPKRAADDVPGGTLRPGDTTYLCAVDGQGMMVSLIQSVSGAYGSGIVAGDTGIVLNNRAGNCFSLVDGHPNIFAPGKKTMHTLNCYSIAAADGTPLLVGGTPGGDGQPQWNLQVIAGLIDAGLDVQAAIELPRWTSWPGTYPVGVDEPFELRLEDRFGDDVVAALADRGHRVSRVGPWGAGGSAQAIARDPESGVLAGGSDPRAEGLALGF